MKKINLSIAILAAFLTVGVFSSCRHHCVRGSGNQTTETRKAGEFKKIDVSGSYKVILKQDSSYGVVIKADDNLLKYITTSVENGTLIIKSKKNFCDAGDVVINIGVRNLEAIDAAGADEITSDGKLNVGNLSIDVSGATKLTLDVNAANLSTTSSGTTELKLSGQAAKHTVDVSGAINLKAFDFVVGEYNIETSGIADCEINVLKTLNAHTSGASDIKYKGSPSTVNNDKSGASTIKKVD